MGNCAGRKGRQRDCAGRKGRLRDGADRIGRVGVVAFGITVLQKVRIQARIWQGFDGFMIVHRNGVGGRETCGT